MLISKLFTFEASHILPKHPGKCSRLHGHSWKLTVSVEGPIHAETGFVCDYGELKKLVDCHIIERLDHSHLGQGSAVTNWPCSSNTGIKQFNPYFGSSFYPSSENLCRAIFKLLSPLVQELATNVRLAEIAIEETCTSRAVWRRCDEDAGSAT